MVSANSEYCSQASALVDLSISFDRAAADPVGHQREIDALAEGYATLQQQSPADLADDWLLVGQTYAAFFTAYAAAGYQVLGLVADQATATTLEQLGSTAVLAASDRIEQATIERCGVALGLGEADELDDALSAAESPTASTLDDSGLTELGIELLDGFGIEANAEQQLCLGRAVSDPGFDPRSGSEPMAAYRQLADSCGIDLTLLGSG